jgi:WD40 repeat protein
VLNGNVPKDLETITLKCLDKEPGRRYQTSQELADELRRYLRGEAILARPIGRLERSRRWAKREPVLAALVLGVVILSVVSTITAAAFFVGKRTIREALDREIGLRAEAEAATVRESTLRRQTELAVDREAELRRKSQAASAREALLRKEAQAAEARELTLRRHFEAAAAREKKLLGEAKVAAANERQARQALETQQAELIAATRIAEQQAAVAEEERKNAAHALAKELEARRSLQQELYFSNIANAELSMFLGEADLVRQILSAQPKLERWEWRFLASKCDESHSRLSVGALTGELGNMGSTPDVCTWDPQGQYCAIAGCGGHGIHLIDPASKTVRTVTGHFGTPSRVEWSSDGKTLAVVGDAGLFVIARESGKISFQRLHENAVGAWSPVGQELLGSRGLLGRNESLAILRPMGGTLIESSRIRWPKHRKLYHAAWSNDGERVALLNEESGLNLHVLERSGSPLWNTQAWSSTEREIHAGPPTCLFSPSGRYIAVLRGDQRRIRIFNALTGAAEFQFQGDPVRVQAACWGPDGDLIAVAGSSGFISIWNVNDRMLARKLVFSAWGAEGIAWSHGHNALLAVDGAEQLALWSSSSIVPNRFRYAIGKPDFDPQLFWSSDSRFLTVAHRSLFKWDIETGKTVGSVAATGAMELFGPNGTRSVRMEIPDGSNYPSRLRSLQLFDVTTQEVVRVLDRREKLPRVGHNMCWSENGKLVAVAAGDKPSVLVYDVELATLRSTISLPVSVSSLVQGIDFAPDGDRVAVAFGTGLVVSKTSTAHPLFENESLPAMKVNWSPCGDFLVVGGQDRITVLDALGEIKSVIKRSGFNLGSPAIRPGGDLIAILTDVAGVPELYDVATGRHVLSLHGMQGVALSWSPNGNCLAVAGDDGCVEVLCPP